MKKGDGKMTIFMVETYVIKPEKQEEFMSLLKKWYAETKKNEAKYKELKSYKIDAQMFGGNRLGYFEMWEFESLADLEKLLNRINQDKEFLKVVSDFTSCIVPDTWSINIWAPEI